jgi:hypothetical protein
MRKQAATRLINGNLLFPPDPWATKEKGRVTSNRTVGLRTERAATHVPAISYQLGGRLLSLALAPPVGKHERAVAQQGLAQQKQRRGRRNSNTMPWNGSDGLFPAAKSMRRSIE